MSYLPTSASKDDGIDRSVPGMPGGLMTRPDVQLEELKTKETVLTLLADDSDVAALEALRARVLELGGFNDTGARLLSATATLLVNGSKAFAVLGGLAGVSLSAMALMMDEHIFGLTGLVFTYPTIAGVYRLAYAGAKRLLRTALKREAGPALGSIGGEGSPVALPAPGAVVSGDRIES